MEYMEDVVIVNLIHTFFVNVTAKLWKWWKQKVHKKNKGKSKSMFTYKILC